MIDRQEVASRYETVLHLLKKPALSRGAQPFQDILILIRLRNELVHYKSKWGGEMEREKLQVTLEQLRHSKPPFVSDFEQFLSSQVPKRCMRGLGRSHDSGVSRRFLCRPRGAQSSRGLQIKACGTVTWVLSNQKPFKVVLSPSAESASPP
jgi:hypothetical protein